MKTISARKNLPVIEAGNHKAIDTLIMQDMNIAMSEFPVKETIDRMVSIIETQGWHLFARIDHAEHAQKKGLALRPTELILFGNPEIGTRLMQDRQISAIDLPMKALAWEDELGQVRIAHNSIAWLRQRHGLTDEVPLQAVNEVLTKICAGARKGA